jgi:NAD(P)H dehydrogenase (quinone)
MPGRVDAQERAAYLPACRKRLSALDSTEPLFFHPWDEYDETQRLKSGVVARSGVRWNPVR